MLFGLDLIVRNSPGSQFATMTDYVRGRTNYEFRDGAAMYANRWTGVYFRFKPRPMRAGDREQAWAEFQINLERPTVFMGEAIMELEKIAKSSELLTRDSLIEGDEPEPYDGEHLLDVWARLNLRACTKKARDANWKPHTLPGDRLESIWFWNYARETRIERDRRGFVPSITFYDDGGRVRTSTIYIEGDPIYLPRVDLVKIARRPRGGEPSDRDVVWSAAEWSEFAALQRETPSVLGKYPELAILDPDSCAAFAALCRKFPRVDSHRDRQIPTELVLDAELVDKAREP